MWPAGSRLAGGLLVALLAVEPAAAAGGPEPGPEASTTADRLALARERMAQGDLKAAASALREALAADPGAGEAHRFLAEVLERQGLPEEARRERQAAYDAGIRDPAMLRALGRDRLAIRAYGPAATVLLEADALEPLPFGPRRGLALALHGAGRNEEAARQLGVLVALDPDDMALRAFLARVELLLDRPVAALADIDRILQARPGDVETWLLRGKTLAQLDRLPEAIRAFEQVLSLDSPPGARSIAQADIGSARGRLGDPVAAEDAYRRALVTDPANAIAAANLADLLVDRGEAAEAERLLRGALPHNPRAAVLHYHLGKAYLALDRADEAVAPLRLAVDLEPESPRYHYQLALALHRTGKTEEAEREMAAHHEILERFRRRAGKGMEP